MNCHYLSKTEMYLKYIKILLKLKRRQMKLHVIVLSSLADTVHGEGS